MGNYNDRVEVPLNTVTGGLVGEELLPALKAAMVTQQLFRTIFGQTGERIFVDKVPSYNDTIMPLFEAFWSGETYQNSDTRLTGTIKARIVLPARLTGDTNKQRRIASAFQRFLGSDQHNLFDNVAGLIMFGLGIQFQYDQMLVVDGGSFPTIPVIIPVTFDLHLLRQQKPGVDYDAPLTAADLGLAVAYEIGITNENEEVLIAKGPWIETGQTN